MASSSPTAAPRVTKRHRGEDSPSQEKYSFIGKDLTSQSKQIVMNVVEHFKTKQRKARVIQMLLKEHIEQLVRHDISWNCILTGLLVKVFQ